MKFLTLVGMLFVFSVTSYAESRGDTVYTCHWHRDGWMWTSGSYTACTYIVLEEVGSNNYRIEALDSCEGHYKGDTQITEGKYLFSASSIKFSRWGNKCNISH